MSKIPTIASRPAAVVAPMPWSWAAGTKCVLIMPLVVHPQMKNVPASSQKARVLAANARVDRAVRAALSALWVVLVVNSSVVTTSLEPNGRNPISEGRSRITIQTIGMSARHIKAMPRLA
ncbi:unannotated protein [freshwater metagenome]|uniref:Unannotated protein n=1 Tax=freshwater metagenome TaxID=449393 RepID=A0A6J6UFY6_9ZZZZ